eukprot:gene10224-11272_t
MTRYARGFKSKHVEATSWEDMKASSTNDALITEVKDKREVKESKSSAEMKLEKKRDARRKRRNMKKICFHCRKRGHALSDCPSMKKSESPLDICFKCGSTEHKIQNCKIKVAKDSFPFAKCFVCGEDGHISRKCPDNPRGLYPLGGGCKFCDSVEHFKRDCPQDPQNKKSGKRQSKVALKRHVSDLTSADAETYSSGEDDQNSSATNIQLQVKRKKPTVVKF